MVPSNPHQHRLSLRLAACRAVWLLLMLVLALSTTITTRAQNAPAPAPASANTSAEGTSANTARTDEAAPSAPATPSAPPVVIETWGAADDSFDAWAEYARTADGASVGLFPYPTRISYAPLELELWADAVVAWVITGESDSGDSSSAAQAVDALDAFQSSFNEMEIYAEGHVRLSARDIGTIRATRIYLRMERASEGFVLRGVVTEPRAHVFPREAAEAEDALKKPEQRSELLRGTEDRESQRSSTNATVDAESIISDAPPRPEDEELFKLEQGRALFFRAERMRIFNLPTWPSGTKTIEIDNADITTSSLAIPGYAFKAEAVRIDVRPTRRGVTMRNPALALADHRVLVMDDDNYYYDIDSTFPVTRLRIGDSSAFGNTLRFRMDVITAYDFFYDPEPTFRPFEFSPIIDYFDKRGTGVGAEFAIGDARPFATGFDARFEGYFIGDQGDRRDIARTLGWYPLENRDRGRFKGYARLRTPDRFQADLYVNYASDRNVIEEFFRAEYRQNDPQRSFIRVRKDIRNRSYYVDASLRARHFVDEVEKLPELGYGSWREPVLPRTLGLQLTSEATLGHYRLHLRDDSHPLYERSVLRGDASMRLYRPFDFGTFSLDPYLGWRATFSDTSYTGPDAGNPLYDEGVGFVVPPRTGVEDEFVSRIQFLAGASIGTHVAREYSGVQNELFDINGLRHVMSPLISYEFVEGPENRSHRFVQMDEVDRADNVDRFMLRMRNRFMTKRRQQGQEITQDILDLMVQVPLYMQPHRDNGGQRFGDIEVSARMHPTSQVALRGGIFLTPDELEWRRMYLSAGFSTQQSDWRLYYRNVRNVHEVIGGTVSAYFSAKYSATISQEYDIVTSKARDTHIGIARTFFEALAVQANFRRDAITRDVSIGFSFDARFGPGQLASRVQ